MQPPCCRSTAQLRRTILAPIRREGNHLQTIENSCAVTFLPVSIELAFRLAEANVRYGVFKNAQTLDAGLAGIGDIDLLVSAEDAEQFRSVMLALKGIRGVPSPLYDNAVRGREDWFIPEADGRYLHLDTSFGLRIGRKFHKRYEALQVEDVIEWQQRGAPEPAIPVVSPYEEARIAVLRSVFRLPAWPGRAWVRPDSDIAGLLRGIFTQDQEKAALEYRFGPSAVACPVRRRGDRFELQGNAIRQLRKAIRAQNGHGLLAVPSDFIVHHARHLAYFAAGRWTSARPGRSVAKRRLESAGVVIALIGPDGVGKSTQTARLTEVFRKKFRCTSVYLGSNDGAWMKYRAALRRRFSRADARTNAPAAGGRKKRDKRSGLHVAGSAFWRLVIAVQRHMAMRKALRLAASGAIVITDRWPQTLRYGYLDGPSVPPPPTMRLAGLLSRIERRIYRVMERHKPTLTIHLDCDFATSHARKPGDIGQADFERRIELMQEMRQRDPCVEVVDARQDMQAVTEDLARLVWLSLWNRNAKVRH